MPNKIMKTFDLSIKYEIKGQFVYLHLIFDKCHGNHTGSKFNLINYLEISNKSNILTSSLK